MPKFSLIIPTRTRADTLEATLRSATQQSYDDIEILVHECGDDPRTRAVVAAAKDDRVRHVKTGTDVPMTENWERAVAAATGEYLGVVGDDDAFMPDACAQAAPVAERYAPELITWQPAAYFWPNSVVESRRNRLQADLSKAAGYERLSPRMLLEQVFRFRAHHYSLPMVLHSFVRSDLIARIQRETGKYLHSPAPDIASGVVDAFFARSCVRVPRPLSISGLSHNSTGGRMHFNRNVALRESAEEAAFGRRVAFDTVLVDSRDLFIFAANELLAVKREVFPTSGPPLYVKGLLRTALGFLASGLEDYDQCLADIREVAALNDVSLEHFAVPPRVDGGGPAAVGVLPVGPGAAVIDIDCSRAGIRDVTSAATLLAAILPPLEPPPEMAEPLGPLDALPAEPDTSVSLRFGSGEAAMSLLSYGWSEPEQWGVWSVEASAALVVQLDARPSQPLSLRIRGRTSVHRGHPTVTGRVLVNEHERARFRTKGRKSKVDIIVTVSPDEIGADGALPIEFVVDDPVSPAAYGVSSDTRTLGFGLEELVVSR